MELKRFQQTLRQAMVLPVVACLALAAVLAWQIQSANTTVTLIEHSDSTIALATRLQLLIVDEETGLRGYQTTGDSSFLEPYRRARAALPGAIQQMRSNAPGPTPNLEDFLRAHDAWENGFAQPIIDIIRAGGRADDTNLNLTGKVQMDRMRGALNTITERSEALRSQRTATWHRQTRDLTLAVASLALGVGLLMAMFARNRLHAVSAAFVRSLQREKLRAQELRDSEENLRTTLVSIGDGVITCDTQGRVQLMNPVAQALTGWQETDARGRPIEEVFRIVNERTREPVESPVAKVQRLGAIVGLANHTTLLRRDGSEIAIDDSGAPIRNEAGRLTGVVMVFRDVTIERRTRAALLANEKLAAAGRLAASIAHEIHNPLDSVANLLYLLGQDPSAQDARHFLDLAQSELARVTHISRAILSLYRESNAPVPIHLKETLEEVLLLMGSRFHSAKVQLRTDLPVEIVVQGFPAELRQVFSNVLSNAIEAAGANGTVDVRLVAQSATPKQSGKQPEEGAVVEIVDNGPGIPPEAQQRLFQPFFTTKGEQGTGLGLWISEGIMRKHGGSIKLMPNANGRGTTARIFLPTRAVLSSAAD